MASVDVVVVSYNSRDELRSCVSPLADLDDVCVIVVDNDSPDDSLSAIADLDVTRVQLRWNRGFGHGCNVGWRAGTAPFVLFLNPDATIGTDSLQQIVRVLQERPEVGLVGPRLVSADGSLILSQRRFLRLGSLFAQAFFLQRLFPRAEWADEVIRDGTAYDVFREPEWVSGACMLVRRSLLESIGGFDERFFLYCEDDDLCRRIWATGHSVAYEPGAVCVHVGGASAPRALLLPVSVKSRLRYAEKYYGRPATVLCRIAIALGSLTHIVITRGGLERRLGHARSLLVAVSASVTPGEPGT